MVHGDPRHLKWRMSLGYCRLVPKNCCCHHIDWSVLIPALLFKIYSYWTPFEHSVNTVWLYSIHLWRCQDLDLYVFVSSSSPHLSYLFIREPHVHPDFYKMTIHGYTATEIQFFVFSLRICGIHEKKTTPLLTERTNYADLELNLQIRLEEWIYILENILYETCCITLTSSPLPLGFN